MRQVTRGLALALALLLCGCAAGEPVTEDVRYTVGVLLKSMQHQHWMDVRAGVLDAAKAENVEVILLYPQEESAVEEQREMFHDLVAAQPDAILLAPCDSTDCAPLAAEAEQAGIALLALDTRAEDVSLPYIGADNYQVGRLAAQRLAEVLDGAGKTAVIAGVAEQAAHKERIAGFQDALAEYDRMEVTAVVHADSDFMLAMERTAELMEAHPDLGGIFCTSAVMALGCVEQQSGAFYAVSPAVVAVDTQDDALNALQNGRLEGLVSQDGYEAGYQAVRQAVRLLEGNPIADNTYITTELLTRSTVDEFMQERLRGAERTDYAESAVGG